MPSTRSRYWPTKAHHFFWLVVHRLHRRTQLAICFLLHAACYSYFDFRHSLLFPRCSLSKLFADLLFTYHGLVFECLGPRTSNLGTFKKRNFVECCTWLYNNSWVRTESVHILIASQNPIGFHWLSKCGLKHSKLLLSDLLIKYLYYWDKMKIFTC